MTGNRMIQGWRPVSRVCGGDGRVELPVLRPCEAPTDTISYVARGTVHLRSQQVSLLISQEGTRDVGDGTPERDLHLAGAAGALVCVSSHDWERRESF